VQKGSGVASLHLWRPGVSLDDDQRIIQFSLTDYSTTQKDKQTPSSDMFESMSDTTNLKQTTNNQLLACFVVERTRERLVPVALEHDT
jgi:hypothetical protein